MAILEGGHIVPPRTQATSRSPAPLGLKSLGGNTQSNRVIGSPLLIKLHVRLQYAWKIICHTLTSL